MSIGGMMFDDDYSQALAEHKTRNGMSVREIYDALNERDRLRYYAKQERNKREMLEKHVNDACWELSNTCLQYKNLANGPYSAGDRIEFGYRAKSLEEAIDILRRSVEEVDDEER